MDLTQDLAYGRTRSGGTRYIGILLVILLHVGIVYALITGLASQAVELIKAPLETKIIQEQKPPPKEPPPPPPPKMVAPPPPFIPPPEIQIQAPPPPPHAITQVTHVAPPKAAPAVVPRPAPAPAPAVQHTVVQPSLGDASSSCRPEYPSVSRDLQEEGTVVVRFTVNENGSVSDPQIETSSGHSRLDRAMLNKLANCTFTAGTVDGKPARMQGRLKYTFRLDE